MTGFRLDDSLGYIVNRTAARIRQELQRQFTAHGYGITLAQWMILNRLWEEEGLTQNALAERTFREKTTVARTLALLEEHGLIVRQRDEIDRRNYRIFLTPHGRSLRGELVPLAVAVLGQAREGMSDEQVATLVALLNMVFGNLAQEDAEPLRMDGW